MKRHCRLIGKARPVKAQTTGLQVKLDLLSNMVDFGFSTYNFVVDLIMVSKGAGDTPNSDDSE